MSDNRRLHSHPSITVQTITDPNVLAFFAPSPEPVTDAWAALLQREAHLRNELATKKQRAGADTHREWCQAASKILAHLVRPDMRHEPYPTELVFVMSRLMASFGEGITPDLIRGGARQGRPSRSKQEVRGARWIGDLRFAASYSPGATRTSRSAERRLP